MAHIEHPLAVVAGPDPMIEITDDAWRVYNPLVQMWDIGTQEAGDTIRYGMNQTGDTLRQIPQNLGDNASDTALYVVVGAVLLGYLVTR